MAITIISPVGDCVTWNPTLKRWEDTPALVEKARKP